MKYRPLECFSPGPRKQDSKWAEWKGLEEGDFHAPAQPQLDPIEDEPPQIIYLNAGFGGVFREEYVLRQVAVELQSAQRPTFTKFTGPLVTAEALCAAFDRFHRP